MVNLTADDLLNLAKMIGQFDKMGGRFNGRLDYETQTGRTIPVFYRYDSESGRHVMVLNPNVSE